MSGCAVEANRPEPRLQTPEPHRLKHAAKPKILEAKSSLPDPTYRFHERRLPAASVKTRSNSFHSTLEPNTEVFSKVSRSLAQFTLVNSVSTLLNKGGSTCNCPRASQDFCVNQNKQASAQLLCSSLVLSRHERSEGRRNSCEAEKCTHSEQHAPLQGCREDISGVLCSSWPTQKNMSTCQSHATNMPRFMPMFVQVKTPTNLKRQIEGKQKKAYFLTSWAKSRSLRRGETGRLVTHLWWALELCSLRVL